MEGFDLQSYCRLPIPIHPVLTQVHPDSTNIGWPCLPSAHGTRRGNYIIISLVLGFQYWSLIEAQLIHSVARKGFKSPMLYGQYCNPQGLIRWYKYLHFRFIMFSIWQLSIIILLKSSSDVLF